MPKKKDIKLRKKVIKLYKQMLEIKESNIPITIGDIARESGVSRETVYQIINEYEKIPPMPVKEENDGQ